MHPQGREAVGDTERSFSAANGDHYMQWGITLKRSVWPQRACTTIATHTTRQPRGAWAWRYSAVPTDQDYRATN